MKLGMQVGLDPGHTVLDGDPVPLPKGAQPPNFRPMSIVAKRSPILATAEYLFTLLSGIVLLQIFCVISANSGSFRAHCVKVHVRYLIS